VKNYIYYISIFLVITWIFYIGYAEAVIQFVIFILLYWTVFYWIYFLYKKIRKQNIKKYKHFLINFIKKTSLSIVILVITIWAFGYYQINISPAVMLEYTIGNWEKKVVFQEMSHIWAKSFYTEVRKNLTLYKQNSFVYFYEWVKPGKKENMTKFDKAIWISFNKDLYKNFSKLYWVSFQDNSIYLWLINELDFNVDVSIDWIIEEYEKSSFQSSPEAEEVDTDLWNKDSIIDINSEIIKTLSELNERELKVLVFINKAILNTLIKSDSAQKLINDNFANQKLFEVILEWRNKILTEEIIKTKHKKIYITYWKLHFKWVLKLLQENDKNWKVVSKKELISIK
jgi:hypothetical protein